MKRFEAIGAATLVLIGLTGAALGAPAWERQSDMKSMAESARIIGELSSGKREYDQQEFREAAENIRTHAGNRLVDGFDGGLQLDSKADAEVISTTAGQFAKFAKDLEIYPSALSSAAARNSTELGPDTRMSGTLLGSPFGPKADAARDAASMPAEHAYHLMLQTCTSCHAKFRKP